MRASISMPFTSGLYSMLLATVICCCGPWCAALAGDKGAVPSAEPGTRAPAHPTLAQGVLLVAGKELADPNFSRSVVLITDYGAQGTMGVVLNRRATLTAPLPQFKPLELHPDAIHFGGPVGLNRIMLLVRSDAALPGARRILEQVFMVDNYEALSQMQPQHRDVHNFRIYAGFAGWAPGQLEAELLRGDWHILPATSAIIFSDTPDEIWNELIYLATAKWT